MSTVSITKVKPKEVGTDSSVDLETGVKDKDQPYKTLTKFRRIDSGAKYHPCFGMLCVSDKLGISHVDMVDGRWSY